jgi:glycosyltransferase involved in cell wall biosynthesis
VALVCRLARKPLLVSVHSAGSGKKNHYRTAVSLLAGPLDPTTSWLRTDGNSWVDGDLEGLVRAGKPLMRLASTLLQDIQATLIILNSHMKGYLAAYDFLLPDVRLIPNGVNTIRFHPESEDIISPGRAHVVVCVSKLRYEKGIDVLLQAWHIVHQQQPESRLILVGNGPIEKQLKCMIEALGIQRCVEFAGLQQDVPAQLHRGCLAVLPSRWEGMPNAILEAMACGLPCVATRVTGSEDIIQHGINGLLVENEDYQGMAEALLLLLQDQERTRIYGTAARKTIEKYYSLEHIIDKYIDIYRNITDHRQQRVWDHS